MPYPRGDFEDGFPFIDIEVEGEGGKPEPLRALIDTGDNGFLTLPEATAFKIGLKGKGVQSATLADGGSVAYLEHEGTIIIGGHRVKAIIDVQQKGRVLLGNATLKAIDATFHFNAKKGTVEFTEERRALGAPSASEEEDDNM